MHIGVKGHLNVVNEQDWRVFTENREAVIEQLDQGHCDGILPAARGFLDGFAELLLCAGILDCFTAFPDARARRSIAVFLFCHTDVPPTWWTLSYGALAP